MIHALVANRANVLLPIFVLGHRFGILIRFERDQYVDYGDGGNDQDNKLGFIVEYIPNYRCNKSHYLNSFGQH